MRRREHPAAPHPEEQFKGVPLSQYKKDAVVVVNIGGEWRKETLAADAPLPIGEALRLELVSGSTLEVKEPPEVVAFKPNFKLGDYKSGGDYKLGDGFITERGSVEYDVTAPTGDTISGVPQEFLTVWHDTLQLEQEIEALENELRALSVESQQSLEQHVTTTKEKVREIFANLPKGLRQMAGETSREITGAIEKIDALHEQAKHSLDVLRTQLEAAKHATPELARQALPTWHKPTGAESAEVVAGQKKGHEAQARAAKTLEERLQKYLADYLEAARGHKADKAQDEYKKDAQKEANQRGEQELERLIQLWDKYDRELGAHGTSAAVTSGRAARGRGGRPPRAPQRPHEPDKPRPPQDTSGNYKPYHPVRIEITLQPHKQRLAELTRDTKLSEAEVAHETAKAQDNFISDLTANNTDIDTEVTKRRKALAAVEPNKGLLTDASGAITDDYTGTTGQRVTREVFTQLLADWQKPFAEKAEPAPADHAEFNFETAAGQVGKKIDDLIISIPREPAHSDTPKAAYTQVYAELLRLKNDPQKGWDVLKQKLVDLKTAKTINWPGNFLLPEPTDRAELTTGRQDIVKLFNSELLRRQQVIEALKARDASGEKYEQKDVLPQIDLDADLVQEILLQSDPNPLNVFPKIKAAMKKMYRGDATDEFKNLVSATEPTGTGVSGRLRRAGIKDWQEFKRLWDDKLAKEVAHSLETAAKDSLMRKAAEQMETIQGILQKLNLVKGQMAVRALFNVATIGAGSWGLGKLVNHFDSIWKEVANITRIGAVGAGTGVAKWFGLKKLFAIGGESSWNKSASRELADLKVKTTDELIESSVEDAFQIGPQVLKKQGLLRSLPFIGKRWQPKQETAAQAEERDLLGGLPMLSEVMAGTIREATGGALEVEVAAGQKVVLTGSDRRRYERDLAHLDTKNPDAEQAKKLALAYSQMSRNGDQLTAAAQARGARKESAVDRFIGYYAGKGSLKSSVVFNLGMSALFNYSTTFRMAAGGVIGGNIGYKIAESRRLQAEREQAKAGAVRRLSLVREFTQRVVSNDPARALNAGEQKQHRDEVINLKRLLHGSARPEELSAVIYYVVGEDQPRVDGLLLDQIDNAVYEAEKTDLFLEKKEDRASLEKTIKAMEEVGRQVCEERFNNLWPAFKKWFKKNIVYRGGGIVVGGVTLAAVSAPAAFFNLLGKGIGLAYRGLGFSGVASAAEVPHDALAVNAVKGGGAAPEIPPLKEASPAPAEALPGPVKAGANPAEVAPSVGAVDDSFLKQFGAQNAKGGGITIRFGHGGAPETPNQLVRLLAERRMGDKVFNGDDVWTERARALNVGANLMKELNINENGHSVHLPSMHDLNDRLDRLIEHANTKITSPEMGADETHSVNWAHDAKIVGHGGSVTEGAATVRSPHLTHEAVAPKLGATPAETHATEAAATATAHTAAEGVVPAAEATPGPSGPAPEEAGSLAPRPTPTEAPAPSPNATATVRVEGGGTPRPGGSMGGGARADGTMPGERPAVPEAAPAPAAPNTFKFGSISAHGEKIPLLMARELAKDPARMGEVSAVETILRTLPDSADKDRFISELQNLLDKGNNATFAELEQLHANADQLANTLRHAAPGAAEAEALASKPGASEAAPAPTAPGRLAATEHAVEAALDKGHIDKLYDDDHVRVNLDYKIEKLSTGLTVQPTDVHVNGFQPEKYLGPSAWQGIKNVLGDPKMTRDLATTNMRDLYLTGRVLGEMTPGPQYDAVLEHFKESIHRFETEYGVTIDHLPGYKK